MNAKQLGKQQAYADMLNDGLSKRELIAAMAMQGLCNHNIICASKTTRAQEVAIRAVEYADALLEQLAKE